MFFSMHARGSLVILLLVTYILTDEPSNQKRVSSMYVPEVYSFCYLEHTYTLTNPKCPPLPCRRPLVCMHSDQPRP